MPAFSSPHVQAFAEFCQAEESNLKRDTSPLKGKERRKVKNLVLGFNVDGYVPALDPNSFEYLYGYVKSTKGSVAAEGLIEIYADSHPKQTAKILAAESTESVSEPAATKSASSEVLSASSHATQDTVVAPLSNKQPSVSGYTAALRAPNFLDFQLRTNPSQLVKQADDNGRSRSAITTPFLALLTEVYRDKPKEPSSVAAEKTIKRFLLDTRAAYERRQHRVWGNVFKFSDWLGFTKPPRIEEHNAIVNARAICLGEQRANHNLHSVNIAALNASKTASPSLNNIAAPEATASAAARVSSNTNANTLVLEPFDVDIEALEDFNSTEEYGDLLHTDKRLEQEATPPADTSTTSVVSEIPKPTFGTPKNAGGRPVPSPSAFSTPKNAGGRPVPSPSAFSTPKNAGGRPVTSPSAFGTPTNVGGRPVTSPSAFSTPTNAGAKTAAAYSTPPNAGGLGSGKKTFTTFTTKNPDGDVQVHEVRSSTAAKFLLTLQRAGVSFSSFFSSKSQAKPSTEAAPAATSSQSLKVSG